MDEGEEVEEDEYIAVEVPAAFLNRVDRRVGAMAGEIEALRGELHAYRGN
jgi:hypothetical protein